MSQGSGNWSVVRWSAATRPTEIFGDAEWSRNQRLSFYLYRVGASVPRLGTCLYLFRLSHEKVTLESWYAFLPVLARVHRHEFHWSALGFGSLVPN